MRVPSSAKFPPPSPANDRVGFVHWPADALARACPPGRRRNRPRGRLAAAVDHLLPLFLLVLVLLATGFRG
jgi:hypothetical protein